MRRMDLNTYLDRKDAMSVPELARKACIPHPAQIHQWRNKSGQPPFRYPGYAYCAAIEAATAGLCTCEELNPNLKWSRRADPNWPHHPQGRPLIDPTSTIADEAVASTGTEG